MYLQYNDNTKSKINNGDNNILSNILRLLKLKSKEILIRDHLEKAK